MDDLAALMLQLEWGADEALADAPIDRLRPLAPAPVAASIQPQAPRLPAIARAEAAAAAASSLDELRAALAEFDGCALRDTAAHLVFAEGPAAATLVVVLEAPSAEDDRSGRLASGEAGAFLERMLASIGLHREEVLLAPLVPWRPPGDRPPSEAEIAVCRPFLHRLLAIARPRYLMLMGSLCAKALLPRAQSGRPGRNGWRDAPLPGLSGPTRALVLPSLSQIRRDSSARRQSWACLRMIRHALDAEMTRS